MISIQEALSHVSAVSPLQTETLPIQKAFGRYLANEVISAIDLPPFPQSAMDGYAVQSADLAQANSSIPVRLQIVDTIAAGLVTSLPTIKTGQTIRIFTGAHLPNGADAIVRQENVIRENNTILLSKYVKKGEDLRYKGEEIKKNTRIASAGQKLTTGLLAAIAMAGIAIVTVRKKPKVAVFITGNEVVQPGQTLLPGQVYDANAIMIQQWLQNQNIEHVKMIHLPDDLELVVLAFKKAFEKYDLIFTTGGVSVGERDFVIPGAKKAGAKEIFWKVAQKPGKPFFFARYKNTSLLGFPGNPAAVFAGLHIYGKTLLNALSGAPQFDFNIGILAKNTPSGRKRDQWLRVQKKVDTQGLVNIYPLEKQASHMLTNLAQCNAIAWIEKGSKPLQTGSFVRWIPV